MQYANRGTLGSSLSRGWLRQGRQPGNPPNALAILQCAQEIASALAYLHSHNIIHVSLDNSAERRSRKDNSCPLAGPQQPTQVNAPMLQGDLSANNVLLMSSTRDHRRLTCLVSDFGLARVAAGAGVSTRTTARLAAHCMAHAP